MSELNVASNKAVKSAIGIYEWMNDMFKSFGIVAGGLAASLADWVFGAVTMSVLLSNYTGFSSGWTKWVVGAIFSLALWGVQIVLWQVILAGKLTKIGNNKSMVVTLYVIVLFVIVAMKFGDDFSDITGVYWLIKDNPIRAVFSQNLYKTLLAIIFFLVWVICGFAEVFVALSINLLKDGGKGDGKDNKGGGGGGGGFEKKNGHERRDGSERREQTNQERRPSREERFAQYRAQYPVGQRDGDEPTYHPIPMNQGQNRGNRGNSDKFRR